GFPVWTAPLQLVSPSDDAAAFARIGPKVRSRNTPGPVQSSLSRVPGSTEEGVGLRTRSSSSTRSRKSQRCSIASNLVPSAKACTRQQRLDLAIRRSRRDWVQNASHHSVRPRIPRRSSSAPAWQRPIAELHPFSRKAPALEEEFQAGF